MRIEQNKCVGCQSCLVYCPVGAIKTKAGEVHVDQELCVECAVCIRSGVCQEDGFYQPQLEWPRILRSRFSDPSVAHPVTSIKGRGTAEIKTNDVSNRFLKGEVGFAIELGRPGIATRIADLEKVTMAIAKEVQFETFNPVTTLLDPETGRLLDPTIRSERVLSAIIECKTTEQKGIEVLKQLRKVAEEIDTVFSLCIINRCVDYAIPFKGRMEEAGFVPRINGKTNVGLGRPLA